MTKPLLEVRDLSVEFWRGERYISVVRGVSFCVAPEEALGVVGESGSGKSVTALSIMRLIGSPQGRIASGRIVFEGKNLLDLTERQMRRIRGASIAMVFQDPMMSLNPLMSIGRQLSETLELHQRLSPRGAWVRGAELLEMVGMSDPPRRMDQYPHELSGGMRQRVMIAIALSCKPRLLIADEPTTALDVTIQAQIMDLIDDLRRSSGTSVVWITHDFGVIARSCDRVNVMYGGKILESAEARELFSGPRHPYTRALLQSIPRLDEPRKARLKTIAGSPPEPSNLGPGCPFAPRCPAVLERCRLEFPPPVGFGRLHESRCWQNVRERECLDRTN